MIRDVIDTFENTAPTANQKIPRIEMSSIGQRLLAQQTNVKVICTPKNAKRTTNNEYLLSYLTAKEGCQSCQLLLGHIHAQLSDYFRVEEFVIASG